MSKQKDNSNLEEGNGERKEKKERTEKGEKDASQVSWHIIHTMFEDNPDFLIQHLLDSFNDFSLKSIETTLKKHNPIVFEDENNNKCNFFLGGREANKLYFGKPVIFDNNEAKYMYPNEARLRNMTYGFMLHVDVEVEVFLKNQELQKEKELKKENIFFLEKIYLGQFPIMTGSKLCVLHGFNPEVKIYMGERRNDLGGYFIVNGKEKYIPSYLDWTPNEVVVLNEYHAFVKSEKNEFVSLEIIKPNDQFENGQIHVKVPGFSQAVPLFILMRALGIESDKDIISTCLLDLTVYQSYLDCFIPSVHDASRIFSQKSAIDFLSLHTNSKTASEVFFILSEHLFPHIGSFKFSSKAFYLGYIVFSLLRVFNKDKKSDSPCALLKKSVITPGRTLTLLFEKLFIHQKEKVLENLDDIFYNYRGSCDDENSFMFILNNYAKDAFESKVLEEGFGQFIENCDSTKVLVRNNWYHYMNQLREIQNPFCQSKKVEGSFYGYLDPIDCSQTLGCVISRKCNEDQIVTWLKENTALQPISCKLLTKVFLNGAWIGCLEDGVEVLKEMLQLRRVGVFPFFLSIYFDYSQNELRINGQEGQLLRPLYFSKKKGEKNVYQSSFEYFEDSDDITWEAAVSGRKKKHEDSHFSLFSGKTYPLNKLYPESHTHLECKECLIDFVSPNEENCALLVASKASQLAQNKLYTNLELEASLILGLSSSLALLPDHCSPKSTAKSNEFLNQCSTTFERNLTEAEVTVLNYGENPLLMSRYMDYVNGSQQPYGNNLVIAVMALNGYNSDKGIIINEASMQRGLFTSNFYKTFESLEETNEMFCNPLKQNTYDLKCQVSYEQLRGDGFLRKNEAIKSKKTAIIGKVEEINEEVRRDASVYTESHMPSYVDNVFLTKNENGLRLAKVQTREENKLRLGNTLGSRQGISGSVCLFMPEKDLPFDENGLHPDIIIHPELFLREEASSQILEILYSNVASTYGAFVDSTAFQLKGANLNLFGHLLLKQKIASNGNRVYYDGVSGDMLNAHVFTGLSFYMKLPLPQEKEDVDNKILDDVSYLGMSAVLREMTQPDTMLAICDKTGTIAVYNENKNLFFSLYADGPIQFNTKPNGEMNVKNISRFGRSFSLIKVPHSFYELIQELQVMNIQMKIVTDKNIDQLFSMNFSQNIHKLLNVEKDKSSEDVIHAFVKRMKLALTNSRTIEIQEDNDDEEEGDDKDVGNEIVKPISIEDEEKEVKIILNPEVVTEKTEEPSQMDIIMNTVPLIKKSVNENVTSDNILKVEDKDENKDENEDEKKEKSNGELSNFKKSTESSNETKKTVSFDEKSESSSSNVKKIKF